MHKYHGIKAILNLRDESKGDWYREEKAAADALGIKLVDYPLSSAQELSVEQAEQLAMLMKDLPKPFLIHCEHGANRTGLASAIYLDAVAKKGDRVAERQLSPFYGHVPFPVIGRYAMYVSYKNFQRISPL